MVFSFVKGSRLAVRGKFVNELRYFSVADRQQVASRIVLENCTDPILNPKVYGTFSSEQKLTILNYYCRPRFSGTPTRPQDSRRRLGTRWQGSR